MARVFIVIGVISFIFNNLLNGDMEVFEISSYENSHDDERENEMIKAANFFNPRILRSDENKYKPLHSYVKQYNQRITEAKMQIPNEFFYSESDKEKIVNLLPDIESHITGFKNKLNKYYLELSIKERVNATKRKRNILKHNEPLNYDNVFEDYTNPYPDNIKLNNYQEEDSSPLLNINIEEINKYIQLSSTISIESTLESTDEYIYDYNAITIKYEEQTEKDKYINDTLNHKKEQMVEESSEKMISINNTINCTKEDTSYFNINTLKCLLYNYQYMKNKPETRKMLSNIWLIIKIWLCLYVCIAIPCWCQRGWCCWWFRCKICFPRKRIMFAKQYYVRNPPGILMSKLSKKKSMKYEPSEVEEDLYEQFEAAIRNI